MFFPGNHFDEFPNEVNDLPKNIQKLVTEAMQTVTFESSLSASTELSQSSTSGVK